MELMIFIAIIITILFIINRLLYDRLPQHDLLAITGSLGTGKSMLGSKLAVSKFKKNTLKYKLTKVFKWNLAPESVLHRPKLYTNYDIFIKKNVVKKTAFDILHHTDFNRGDVVVLDELSNDKRFNQWAQKDQVEFLDKFFRNSRKLGLYVIVLDQSILNLNYSIKRRSNFIVNLNEFKRLFNFVTIKYQTYQMLDGNNMLEYEPRRNKSNMLLNKKYKMRMFKKYDTNELIE